MTKVKICGLSRAEDIAAVNTVLPDYTGFVFAPSRRRVDMKTSAILKESLDQTVEVVGVFVNENINVVADIYQNGIIDMVQLHGDEDDDYIKRLKERCDCRVIKAVGVGSTLPPLPLEVDYLLFDTLSAARGGVGRTFDWNILNDYCGIPYFLAGGLSADNVVDSLRLLNPFCVDVSSGVETSGVKDAEKIEIFVSLVRRNRK
ncbi:MAG: phosphoribosylanthranilate isomerase [Oscillospiraceae bacterium]|nr:phosphoribosylanthranilate isomerase [Oscillospiraceae bacterium]